MAETVQNNFINPLGVGDQGYADDRDVESISMVPRPASDTSFEETKT